jgi:hypothetical protein
MANPPRPPAISHMHESPNIIVCISHPTSFMSAAFQTTDVAAWGLDIPNVGIIPQFNLRSDPLLMWLDHRVQLLFSHGSWVIQQ